MNKELRKYFYNDITKIITDFLKCNCEKNYEKLQNYFASTNKRSIKRKINTHGYYGTLLIKQINGKHPDQYLIDFKYTTISNKSFHINTILTLEELIYFYTHRYNIMDYIEQNKPINYDHTTYNYPLKKFKIDIFAKILKKIIL